MIKSICFEKEKINWEALTKKVDAEIAQDVKKMLKEKGIK